MIKLIWIKGVLLGMILLMPGASHAQIMSDFTISIFGGIDVTVPTIPTVVNVDPIATTQINIEWTASVDDTALSGYVVYRDGFAIATTTSANTVFSDTGLISSTTYSYAIQAFDTSYNYSSSSPTVSTTTLSLITSPVSPQQPVTNSSTRTNSNTLIAVVYSDDNSAVIEVSHAKPTRYSVRYGTTASFELGYILSEEFEKKYRFEIPNLQPDTTYLYQIISESSNGVTYLAEEGSFKTDTVFSDLIPNVSQLTTTQRAETVAIEYVLPGDDYAVRVVKNYYKYPTSITDGLVVYEGDATGVIDSVAFAGGSSVFYTVFVLDNSGRASSGAVSAVYDARTGVPSEENVTDESVAQENPVNNIDQSDQKATSTAQGGDEQFTFVKERILVKQNNATTTLGAARDMVSGLQNFVVAVPASMIDRQAEVVTVSFKKGSDKDQRIYTFIARQQFDGEMYVALIPPLYMDGNVEVVIETFDGAQRQIQSVSITASLTSSQHIDPEQSDIESIVVMLILIGCLGLLPIYLFTRLGYVRLLTPL